MFRVLIVSNECYKNLGYTLQKFKASLKYIYTKSCNYIPFTIYKIFLKEGVFIFPVITTERKLKNKTHLTNLKKQTK